MKIDWTKCNKNGPLPPKSGYYYFAFTRKYNDDNKRGVLIHHYSMDATLELNDLIEIDAWAGPISLPKYGG